MRHWCTLQSVDQSYLKKRHKQPGINTLFEYEIQHHRYILNHKNLAVIDRRLCERDFKGVSPLQAS